MTPTPASLVLAVLALTCTLGSTSACGGRTADPRAQWFVTLHTDAPVPQLGDRVLVEVLDRDGAAACSGCRRLFGARAPEDWPLSFGIPDPGGRDMRLRVRLFRADHSDAGGAPSGQLTIDDLSILPATGGNVREVASVLYTECAGVAADLAATRTCVPSTSTSSGALATRAAGPLDGPPPRPGSIPVAAASPCTKLSTAGMVCVPGGLFARGNSTLLPLDVPVAQERLVRVSAFWLDEHELTVGELRTLVAAGKVPAPKLRSKSTLAAACTYTAEPDELEDSPANCLRHAVAESACAAQGKRLPTEAEWEYAAGNRDRESRYPWGDDESACDHAIVGRGRVPPVEENTPLDPSSACRAPVDGPALAWGPRPVREADDKTDLGILGLGGNVAEWVADTFSPYGEGACSAGPRVLVDPKCETGKVGSFVIRGGSWNDYAFRAEGARRQGFSEDEYWAVGVRCARSD